MKFTLSWLKDHLETTAPLHEITERLTALGLEVEGVEDAGAVLAPFIVAEILEAVPHPNADKLRVCKVNNGRETLQIVCGAPNARAGIKVILASIGTVIPTNGLVIKQSKIRDVESNGMLCSAAELGITGDSEGIVELPAHAEIGKPFAAFIGLDDPVIEIAITPNRGDCLGVRGIARDLAASGVGVLKPLEIPTISANVTSPITVKIDTENTGFIGVYIAGVKNTQSPEWLQQGLKAIGQKPISAIVDVTNYLSFTFGRPAHVYDADKIRGHIIVRRAHAGETFAALNDQTYHLSPEMVVIADDSGAIGLAGIIGGASTACSAETRNVFLEVAAFDAIDIATAGRILQLNTDARYRFERKIDLGFLHDGAKLGAQMILDFCGGSTSGLVQAGITTAEPRTVSFRPARVAQLVGMEVPEKTMESILQKLGCDVLAEGAMWQVQVPSWRHDVTIEEDIVEEIARVFGYATMPATPLPLSSNRNDPLSPAQKIQQQLRHTLVARGVQEAVTFGFTHSRVQAAFVPANTALTLANPISAELDVMRQNILPNLLLAVARNQARGMADVALFESAAVFSGTTPDAQANVLGCIRAGALAPANAHKTERTVDAFDAKADALAALAHYVPTQNLSVSRDAIPGYYHPGRSGALVLGKQVVAYFGELHPAVLKAQDVSHAVACEVFLDAVPQPRAKKSSAKPKLQLVPFPAVTRDFAFVVDARLPVQDVVSAVRKAEKKLITDVRIFDIYQGKGVADGKKSVALSVRLQPLEKTLTDAEIDAISTAIITGVQLACSAELRA